MGVLRGTSGASGLRGRLSFAVRLAALLVCGFLAPGQMASAGSERGILRYHTTVVNGDLVGSAFGLTDTILATNAHVVEGRAVGEQVRLVASDGTERRAMAVVVGISRWMDLAVLQAPVGFLDPVAVGESPQSRGHQVVAAGVDASGGQHSGRRLALPGRVTDPEKNIDVFGPGLIADIPGVRPGFSGGPVLDGRGQLVGMLTAIRRTDGLATSGSRGGDQRGEIADQAYILRADAVVSEALRLAAAASGRTR